jgi:hypothetical protein
MNSDALAVRDRYVAKFPLWSMPAGPAAEERARTWTLGLCNQLAHDLPGQNYGSKRADQNRPISKDAVAQKQPNGALFSWDMLSESGSGSPKLVPNPEHEDITGQVFVQVEGIDVISGEHGSTPTPPPATVPPYNEDYSIQFGNGCNAAYKEAKKSGYDSGMVAVHASRAAWDYYSGKLTWEESYKLHLNDFRAEYGLKPL